MASTETGDEAAEAAATASSIRAVRHGINSVTSELGYAMGQLAASPERALASLDSALSVLKAARDLFATVTAEPGQES